MKTVWLLVNHFKFLFFVRQHSLYIKLANVTIFARLLKWTRGQGRKMASCTKQNQPTDRNKFTFLVLKQVSCPGITFGSKYGLKFGSFLVGALSLGLGLCLSKYLCKLHCITSRWGVLVGLSAYLQVILAACPLWGGKASAMMTVSCGGIIPQSRATETAVSILSPGTEMRQKFLILQLLATQASLLPLGWSVPLKNNHQ